MRPEPELLYVVAVGAHTAVGRTAWASAAAVRAGVCGFSQHPFMLDTVGEPIRVAASLSVEQGHKSRCCELLLAAMDQVMGPADALLDGVSGNVALLLALPGRRPGRDADLAERVRVSVGERYAGRFAQARLFQLGHASGYVGLETAVQLIRQRRVDACVIAGVDSYIQSDTLAWIEACDQFHGAGPFNNAWGYIPGEAAGAIVIGSASFTDRMSATPLAEVVSVGTGLEHKLIKTDAVCVGEGLTSAFRAALATLDPGERIDTVFCDLNGEPYRADEYAFTCLRTKDRFRAAGDFVAPADCWGDVGAASAPLHLSLAAIAHYKGYAKGPLSMCWASSEGGERGAAIVRAASDSRSR